MANRRALIVAPLYDGKWLPPLSGRPVLVERLRRCLQDLGGYDVRVLDTVVTNALFRDKASSFFDSPGELLFYFYGHGCLGASGLGFFARSDARLNDEGVGMHEISSMAARSPAIEVVLILDCCHAGALRPVPVPVFDTLRNYLDENRSFGRDILAACASHQKGWEAHDTQDKILGAFSTYVLRGLEGEARYGQTHVRGTFLAAYVTEVFGRWGQEPVTVTNETGTRHCVITRGFPENAPLDTQPDDLIIIGMPFKPSQLFVGRNAEIDQLLALLVDGDKPVAVSATVQGLGGIGKTELILQLLHNSEIRSAYDVIVWLDGAGPLPPQWEKAVAELDIEFPKSRPKDFLARIEKGLKSKGNVLIVLDNAGTWDASCRWIPLGIPLLVTTRMMDFGGNQFTHIPLGVLSDEAGKSFLARMVPDLEGDPSLPHLLERLNGHALALELAGWNIRYLGVSAREYLDRLERHEVDTRYALTATRYGKPAESCLALTWESLKHDASRTLWRRAALFAPVSAHRDLLRVSFCGPEMFRDEALHAMEYMAEQEGWDPEEDGLKLHSPAEFEGAYAELRAMHVVSRLEGHNGERWAMHRLVRDFGRGRLKESDTLVHGLALSEWLRAPNLDLGPEIPHFVVAILDSARTQSMEGTGRYFAREMAHRSPMLFDSQYFIEFIRDELNDPRALSLILEGLADVNEDVRVQSIRLLENIGPMPEVLKALEASLNDPDPTIRTRAGGTLAKYGGKKTADILAAAVEGPSERARLAAVRALGLMGEKGRKHLGEALQNEDDRVRAKAALFLCEQGQSEGINSLQTEITAAVGERSERMSDSAERKGGSQVVSTLAAILESPADRIRAIRALGKMGGEQAYDLVCPLLYDENDAVRCTAAKYVAKHGDEDSRREIVAALLTSPSEDQGGRSIDFAVELAKKHKIPIPDGSWPALLRAGSWETRVNCATALGQQRATAAVPALVQALRDNDYDVRREVAKALGKIGDAAARPALARIAKKDSDKEVRKTAKAALESLK